MLDGKVVGTGKYLSVLRKKNGKWRIIRDIWNSDPAKPAAKETEQTAVVKKR